MSEKQFCSGSKKNNLRQHSSPAFFYKDRNFNDFQPPEEEILLGICQGKKIDNSKYHRTERVLVRGQKVIQFGKKSKKVKKIPLKKRLRSIFEKNMNCIKFTWLSGLGTQTIPFGGTLNKLIAKNDKNQKINLSVALPKNENVYLYLVKGRFF